MTVETAQWELDRARANIAWAGEHSGHDATSRKCCATCGTWLDQAFYSKGWRQTRKPCHICGSTAQDCLLCDSVEEWRAFEVKAAREVEREQAVAQRIAAM